MTMKLAMYKGKGNFYDKLIRIVTNSKYSHCELVIAGICYSSSPRDRGVRMKYIDLNTDNWDVFDLPESCNQELAINWFIKNVGKKYDWIGAVTSVLPFQINVSNKFFCSEACAEMLNLSKPRRYKPQSLVDYFCK